MTEPKAKLDSRIVEVRTTTVDVKVMRIGNRQLTMSIFRQIPDKPLPEEFYYNFLTNVSDGITVWGVVRYTWKESPYWAGYYVVWQQDDKIYRMAMIESEAYKYGGGKWDDFTCYAGVYDLCDYVERHTRPALTVEETNEEVETVSETPLSLLDRSTYDGLIAFIAYCRHTTQLFIAV